MTIYAMKFVFGYISYFHFTSFPIIVNRMFDKSKLTCIDTNGMRFIVSVIYVGRVCF